MSVKKARGDRGDDYQYPLVLLNQTTVTPDFYQEFVFYAVSLPNEFHPRW